MLGLIQRSVRHVLIIDHLYLISVQDPMYLLQVFVNAKVLLTELGYNIGGSSCANRRSEDTLLLKQFRCLDGWSLLLVFVPYASSSFNWTCWWLSIPISINLH